MILRLHITLDLFVFISRCVLVLYFTVLVIQIYTQQVGLSFLNCFIVKL